MNSPAPIPEDEQGITAESAIEGLLHIHGEVQELIHDQWDWMSASFFVEVLKVFLADKDECIYALEAASTLRRQDRTAMELGKEQIDEAAKAARVTAMGPPNCIGTQRDWEDIEEHYRQEWRDAVIAAAPHLQYAPAPVSGDLVELGAEIGKLHAEHQQEMSAALRECHRKTSEPLEGMISDLSTRLRESTSELTALRSAHESALKAQRETLCGRVTDVEADRHGLSVDGNRMFLRLGVESLLRYRRAQLEKAPAPTLEERIRFYLANTKETDLVKQARHITEIVERYKEAEAGKASR